MKITAAAAAAAAVIIIITIIIITAATTTAEQQQHQEIIFQSPREDRNRNHFIYFYLTHLFHSIQALEKIWRGGFRRRFLPMISEDERQEIGDIV